MGGAWCDLQQQAGCQERRPKELQIGMQQGRGYRGEKLGEHTPPHALLTWTTAKPDAQHISNSLWTRLKWTFGLNVPCRFWSRLAGPRRPRPGMAHEANSAIMSPSASGHDMGWVHFPKSEFWHAGRAEHHSSKLDAGAILAASGYEASWWVHATHLARWTVFDDVVRLYIWNVRAPCCPSCCVCRRANSTLSNAPAGNRERGG